MTEAELVPQGRYEWERLVKRIVMPKPLKFLALVLASFADADGSRVRPGVEVLANITGDAQRTVKRLLRGLRDLGLIEQVSRGGGRGGKGRAATWRLTIPTDLLERCVLLTPGYRPESGDIQMSSQSTVDNLCTVDVSGDTQMSPETGGAAPNEVPSDDHFGGLRGHSGPIEGTSGWPTTTQDQPQNLTNTRGCVPAEQATAREPPPESDPYLAARLEHEQLVVEMAERTRRVRGGRGCRWCDEHANRIQPGRAHLGPIVPHIECDHTPPTIPITQLQAGTPA